MFQMKRNVPCASIITRHLFLQKKSVISVSKKTYESESVYASESDFGWSRKVFQDHTNRVNGFRRPSDTSKIWFDAGLDGVGRASETIHQVCMVSEDLSRPSKIASDA